MVFTVVSFEGVNKDTNEKYLLNSQNCLQNLRGGHIENVIFLVWLLLFCVNVFFSNSSLCPSLVIIDHWDFWTFGTAVEHSNTQG